MEKVIAMDEQWLKYTVEMFWSDEDEGFIAVVPDLPGCSSYGDTREECAREVEDAMQAWLQANAAMVRPVPPVTPSKYLHGTPAD